MNIKKNSLAFFTLCIVIVSVVPAPAQGWKKFIRDDYSILLPKKWTLNKMENENIQFSCISPSEITPGFSENVNFLKISLEGFPGTTLVEFVDLNLDQLKDNKIITDFNLLSRIRGDGENGAWEEVIYSGKMFAAPLLWKQRIYLYKTHSYFLTYVCEANENPFGDITEEIFSSLKFK